MLSPHSSRSDTASNPAIEPLTAPPIHGGRLAAAAQQYRRPLAQWLDLSTGINPAPYPIADIPAPVFQRLPEADDALADLAAAYYGSNALLALPGSQAAIQLLPRLRSHSRVGILSPAYLEHAYHWRLHGHDVYEINQHVVEQQLHRLDVLVVINPNNPCGGFIDAERLREWQQHLAARNGWLLLDEAFVDSRPEYSMIRSDPLPGLIILRSLGKFFGLAGIRCGFVHAQADLLTAMTRLLGPWPLSGPTRYVAAQALADSQWQQQTQTLLQDSSQRLRFMLANWQRSTINDAELLLGCDFFQTLQLPSATQAQRLYEQLAETGILTRLLPEHRLLRLGLPHTDGQWQRLQTTFDSLAGAASA